MKNVTPVIGVVVPIHNGLEQTRSGLASLQKSIDCCDPEMGSIQVIVVDDGSTDGSADWISAHFPTVRLLKADGDLWWTGAMNVGAHYAVEDLGCEYVAAWNNDIQCAPDYFTRLFDILANTQDHRIIASKIFLLDEPDRLYAMGCLFNPVTGRQSLIGSKTKDGGQFEHVHLADWAPGMGTVAPKRALEAINYWDARTFPQYCGDSDFCLRAKNAGFPLFVYPQLRIWNDKRTSGIEHNGTVRLFIRTLVDRRSSFQLQAQVAFYLRHAKSPRALIQLVYLYIRYAGSFARYILRMAVAARTHN